MAIQRWDPERDLVELQDRMNPMFDDALSRSVGSEGGEPLGSTGWKPPMDLIEEPTRFVLRADLPGISAADVEIQVEKGTLIVRGERRMDTGFNREAYLRVERPHGPFAVQLALPSSVEQRGIEACHKNGVIEIVLPKRKEELPSRIEISD